MTSVIDVAEKVIGAKSVRSILIILLEVEAMEVTVVAVAVVAIVEVLFEASLPMAADAPVVTGATPTRPHLLPPT